MKKIITLILLSICFFTLKTNSHQDFYIWDYSDNVLSRIESGFRYEEIYKVNAIRELVHKLCDSMNYQDSVFLDFSHHYTGNCIPDYFLSLDTLYDSRWGTILQEDKLIIRAVSRYFFPLPILKLAEYGIINRENIDDKQQIIKYNKNYCNWDFKGLDSNLIQKILKSETSELIKNIISQETLIEHEKSDFLPYENDQYFKIFFLNNMFVFKYQDKEILKLDNYFDYEPINFEQAFFFDTDSSFYFYNGYRDKLSRKHTLKIMRIGAGGFNSTYLPKNMTNLHGNLVSFFWGSAPEKKANTLMEKINMKYISRHSIYDISNDTLIQNLETLIYPIKK